MHTMINQNQKYKAAIFVHTEWPWRSSEKWTWLYSLQDLIYYLYFELLAKNDQIYAVAIWRPNQDYARQNSPVKKPILVYTVR